MTAAPTFEELFRSAKRSAVHLEMRDGYMRDADFEEWQAGNRFDPAERWRSWFDLMRATTHRGVVVRRARIVSEPISDYIRFEYDVTASHNVAAGESVRWLPRKKASAIALPGNDFWLFDGEAVLFNHFAGNGDMLAEEYVTDPSAVELCGSAFEAVWDRAIPHEDYRPV
ncbi:DUF6879 family protein [Streptomyces coeruleoprunus]|uniref:DUF6879 family protein n=1 Tax=Streptomyces coeruleoprunus TaxID=285563 RepID=A0ABV9XIV5_9ACTN